jgi:hypothetical protein
MREKKKGKSRALKGGTGRCTTARQNDKPHFLPSDSIAEENQ